MQVGRLSNKRKQERQQFLADLQSRVELYKKLDGWFKKQAEREKELENIIRALLDAGETQTNIKAMTGLTAANISSITGEGKEPQHNTQPDNEAHESSSNAEKTEEVEESSTNHHSKQNEEENNEERKDESGGYSSFFN